jgi:hypothetical protein
MKWEESLRGQSAHVTDLLHIPQGMPSDKKKATFTAHQLFQKRTLIEHCQDYRALQSSYQTCYFSGYFQASRCKLLSQGLQSAVQELIKQFTDANVG